MTGNSAGASTPESLSTKLNRLSETAKAQPEFNFKTLAHWIDVDFLRASFNGLKKDAASGVDGISAIDYAENLEANLKGLHQRLKERRYSAQPLRRTYIGKEDGSKRPLSIPSLEDKIVQRAVVMILERIYENDFLDCSYGYRPKRDPHMALDQIGRDIVYERLNWIIDADIKDYFGSIVRERLMEFLSKRIGDKDIQRLIGKWLRVGVIDDGALLLSDAGIYQGSVISPILANVYLHEVLDLWFKNEVVPRLRGKAKLYRFADDFVLGFQHRDDAERVMTVLSKRFDKFGLRLHPEKTRMVEFGWKAWTRWRTGKGERPKGFTFLGFTLYCATTRKGKMAVTGKTAPKRFRRASLAIRTWCKKSRHLGVHRQWERLNVLLRSHDQYYGRIGNSRSLKQLRRVAIIAWWRSLNRRTRRGKGRMNFEEYERNILRKFPLAPPRLNPKRTNWQLALSL